MILNSSSFYTNVLRIPEAKRGDWRVRHVRRPARHPFSLATARTQFIGGDAPGVMSFPKATTWHELLQDDAVWMSDYPIEQVQLDRDMDGLRGDVLVGGLGLGYVVTALAQRPEVERVVVVELSEAVIDLVWPHTLKGKAARSKVELVHGDLFKYLKRTPASFDGALYDIWASDSEATFFDVVLPLLRLSVGNVRSRPRCWNERVMRAQLRFGLLGNLAMAKQDPSRLKRLCELETNPLRAKWMNWRVPFFQWYEREKPTLDVAMREAASFVERVGIPVEYQGRLGNTMESHGALGKAVHVGAW